MTLSQTASSVYYPDYYQPTLCLIRKQLVTHANPSHRLRTRSYSLQHSTIFFTAGVAQFLLCNSFGLQPTGETRLGVVRCAVKRGQRSCPGRAPT
jgi:hypothetical protein